MGFVNRVTGGSIQYYNTDFDKMIATNETSLSSVFIYFIPVQDAFSAFWLSNHRAETAEVFCDAFLEITYFLARLSSKQTVASHN